MEEREQPSFPAVAPALAGLESRATTVHRQAWQTATPLWTLTIELRVETADPLPTSRQSSNQEPPAPKSRIGLLRFYCPETGKFLSRDPIRERGGINLTAFVLNNPVNYFDIAGLQAATATPPPPRPVNGGAGASGYTDADGNSEDGFFEDRAGGRDNPNVGGFRNGKELLDQMKKLSKDNCCIKNFKIASHGRGSDRPSIPSSEAGANGFFAPGDWQHDDRGPNAATTDDVKAAVADGSIKFCKPCLIEIYGCNLSSLTQPLSAATGCRVVAAGGFCSPKGNKWFTDDFKQGNGPGDDWYESTDGGPPTSVGGPNYTPSR